MTYNESTLAQVANLSVSYKTSDDTIPGLPFEHYPTENAADGSSWRVNTTGDNRLDLLKGREMAAHYIKLLQDQPRAVGLNYLQMISNSMGKQLSNQLDHTAAGFWFYLEELLAKHVPPTLNPFKEAAEQQAQDDAYLTKE